MKTVSPFIYVKDVDKSLSYYKDVFQANTEILMGKDGKTYHAQLIIERVLLFISQILSINIRFLKSSPHYRM